MNILTHSFNEIYQNILTDTLRNSINTMVSPINFNPTVFNYVDIISNVDIFLRNQGVTILKNILEKMDSEFRNAPYRTIRYYVKNTRPRTIITVFGELTYLRTEYQDRHTKEQFCYVDRKLGLEKRYRFDPCICSMVYEQYANSNSMIKVGVNIGNIIHGDITNFENKKNNYVSRQMIFNILNRIKKISPINKVSDNTPYTLYIMADEKFIPSQQENSDDNKKVRQMVKVAVVFEKRILKPLKDGSIAKNKRYELSEKFTYITCERHFGKIFMIKYPTNMI